MIDKYANEIDTNKPFKYRPSGDVKSRCFRYSRSRDGKSYRMYSSPDGIQDKTNKDQSLTVFEVVLS